MTTEAMFDDNATRLYEEARSRLLKNAPLRGDSEASANRTLSAGEIDALQTVGLSVKSWKGGASQDPLKVSITDYMALLETSYSTSQAAQYLKVDASRIRQRLRENSLFGIDYDGEKRLPRFQFERAQVIPGLREILAALPDGSNPLDVAEWFLSRIRTWKSTRKMNPRVRESGCSKVTRCRPSLSSPKVLSSAQTRRGEVSELTGRCPAGRSGAGVSRTTGRQHLGACLLHAQPPLSVVGSIPLLRPTELALGPSHSKRGWKPDHTSARSLLRGLRCKDVLGGSVSGYTAHRSRVPGAMARGIRNRRAAHAAGFNRRVRHAHGSIHGNSLGQPR